MTLGTSTPGSVLVIDDDPLMRELLFALLDVEGIAAHTAESGDEALAWLAAPDKSPEVMLTDLQMPATDITKLAPKLRDARPDALLLGMSGSPADAGELALFDGFLLKPFSTDEFFAATDAARQGQTITQAANETEDDAAQVLDMQVYARMASSLKPAALQELYQITLDDVAARAEKIRSAYADGDSDTCRREAHAIKGGCGMVGAMELRAEAAALEAGAPADAHALHRLETARQRLHRRLNTLR